VGDTGLLDHLNRNPEALAADPESRITPQDRVQWTKGTIEDWVMETQMRSPLGEGGDPARRESRVRGHDGLR
jgi:hypothetical protein